MPKKPKQLRFIRQRGGEHHITEFSKRNVNRVLTIRRLALRRFNVNIDPSAVVNFIMDECWKYIRGEDCSPSNRVAEDMTYNAGLRGKL